MCLLQNLQVVQNGKDDTGNDVQFQNRTGKADKETNDRNEDQKTQCEANHNTGYNIDQDVDNQRCDVCLSFEREWEKLF